MVRFLALWANHADQALCHNGDYAGCNQEGLNADIDQTCNSARRIVRVEGTKNQVSSERSLDSDLRRFNVANFTHQNDVRRLPQHGPNDAREVQTDLVLYLYLIHAGQ